MHQSELVHAELKAQLEHEIQQHEELAKKIREEAVQEFRTVISENEKLKAQLEKLEHDFEDISADYEKDKALWQDKVAFLENQRNQAKNDFADVQKKLELTLAHMQKQKSHNKENSEHKSALLSTIDLRYQTQVQELKEAHTRHVRELEERIRSLEKDLRSLNERNALEIYDRTGGKALLEEKLQELKDNELKLLREIETLKEERDRKAVESQKLFENEREALSRKIYELEKLVQEKENKKAALIFEYERKNAEWHLERDHLIIEKADLQSTIYKLEKKKELVMKDNEKLKNELRSRSRSNLLNTSIGSVYKAGIASSARKNRMSDSRISVNPLEPSNKAEGKLNLTSVIELS